MRQNQNKLLRKVKGRTVLVLNVPRGGDDDEDARDKGYFEDLVKRNPARSETLEITLDRKLFNEIVAAADAMEKDLRSGKLPNVGTLPKNSRI